MMQRKKHWWIKYNEWITPKFIVLWLVAIPAILIYETFFSVPELSELPTIDEFYAYHVVDSALFRAVIVDDEDDIDKLEGYRQFVYWGGQEIEGTYINMDTTGVPTNEQVGLVRYLNDSSIAVIRFKNKGFRPEFRQSTMNSPLIHGCISVSDLHKQEAPTP